MRAHLAAVDGLPAEGDERGWEVTAPARASLQGTADAGAARPFLEKRPPRGSGR